MCNDPKVYELFQNAVQLIENKESILCPHCFRAIKKGYLIKHVSTKSCKLRELQLYDKYISENDEDNIDIYYNMVDVVKKSYIALITSFQ